MEPKGRYRLVIKQGPTPGKVYELVKGVSTIGRDVRSDIVVNDAEVSRSHTRLTAQAEGFLAEDLGSTNGTFINGQRLTGAKLLRPGEMLGLGETVVLELEFLRDPQATVIAAQPPPPPEAAPAPPSQAAPPSAPESIGPSISIGELEVEAQPSRKWLPWVAAGCGCLTLIACVVLVAVGIYAASNPDFLRALGL